MHRSRQTYDWFSIEKLIYNVTEKIWKNLSFNITFFICFRWFYMIQMISYPSINQIGYVLSNAYSISFCYRYRKIYMKKWIPEIFQLKFRISSIGSFLFNIRNTNQIDFYYIFNKIFLCGQIFISCYLLEYICNDSDDTRTYFPLGYCFTLRRIKQLFCLPIQINIKHKYQPYRRFY